MPLLRRLARLIWGDEVDRALRPVLAVGIAGAVAGSCMWSFMGIWAIDRLDASSAQLSVTFLVGAGVAAASGYLGGHLSDHLGRRPVILAGSGAATLYLLGYLLVGDRQVPGLILLAASGLLAVSGSVTQAMVADLVPRERHESAYAAVRIATNLGVVLGPPIGGLFLLVGDWPGLFVGAAVLSCSSLTLAYRFLPRTGAYAPESPPERGSFAVIVRDRPLLLYLVSGIFAWIVYVAYETVLPISLVDSHGLDKSTWGFLVVLNPLMVTLFQMRLTRAASPIPAAPKLVLAMLLMGLPFLLLSVNASLFVVAVVIVVFVVGEMLWVPTSQTVIAGLAPPDLRGAYMGAFGSTAAVGFALAPFLGLQVRAGFGDTAMWTFFAGASILAAAAAALACGIALGRGRRVDPALAQTSS